MVCIIDEMMMNGKKGKRKKEMGDVWRNGYFLDEMVDYIDIKNGRIGLTNVEESEKWYKLLSKLWYLIKLQLFDIYSLCSCGIRSFCEFKKS